MYTNRKIPRHHMSQYEYFKLRINLNKKRGVSIELDIIDISEEGSSVLCYEDMNSLDIADTLEGVLEDSKGRILLRFTGYIVWKMDNKFGIRFHNNISIPEQIIALEISLTD